MCVWQEKVARFLTNRRSVELNFSIHRGFLGHPLESAEGNSKQKLTCVAHRSAVLF